MINYNYKISLFPKHKIKSICDFAILLQLIVNTSLIIFLTSNFNFLEKEMNFFSVYLYNQKFFYFIYLNRAFFSIILFF